VGKAAIAAEAARFDRVRRHGRRRVAVVIRQV